MSLYLKMVLCGTLRGGPPTRERGRGVLVWWALYAIVLLRRRHPWCQSSGAGVLGVPSGSALVALGRSVHTRGGGSFGSHIGLIVGPFPWTGVHPSHHNRGELWGRGRVAVCPLPLARSASAPGKDVWRGVSPCAGSCAVRGPRLVWGRVGRVTMKDHARCLSLARSSGITAWPRKPKQRQRAQENILAKEAKQRQFEQESTTTSS